MRTVALLALVGCASYDLQQEAPPPPPMEERFGELAAAPAAEAEEGAMGRRDAPTQGVALGGAAAKASVDLDARAKNEAKEQAPGKDGGESAERGEEGRTRSWFPEAFLWRPLVETGDGGVAEVDLTVPDALTTWRVLALAHDAQGRQAGSVHSFDGTLPLYVDPVAPGWLYSGDRLVLPVQVVNTTSAPVSASLEVRTEGAMSGAGVASVNLGAAGTDVRTIPLDVVGAGSARITARLSAGDQSDAAERTVPVLPAGRPVTTVRGGTLASTRTFRLEGPEGADPATEEIEVVVFPGPLAVLAAELDRLQGGARPEDGAYGYALGAAVGELSAQANVPVDDAVLRRLRLLAWQRVVYEARAPDPGLAADLLTSLRGAEADPQVHDLLPRLVRVVVDGQRADGTWSRSGSGSLQGVLVQTAYAARALPDDQPGPRLRASAVIERFAHEVKDPYTAAVIVASGLADGTLQDELRKRITEGLQEDEKLGTRLVVPDGVVNAWGFRPSRAEALAWAVLALPPDAPARGDLASQLLQSWSVSYGFGAGRADAVALEAITRALPGAPGPVELALDLDGVRSATGSLDPAQPKVPVTLTAKPGSADPEIVVTATPAVPGLAFVATRRSWVRWSDADRVPGVEVQVQTGPLAVGLEGKVTLRASAPSGAVVRLEQGLPAGAMVGDQVHAAAAAVGARVDVLTDRIVVTSRPFQAGEVLELAIPVSPAFAGRFQTGPLLISVDGAEPVPVEPVVWSVAGVGRPAAAAAAPEEPPAAAPEG